jgi:hypothetical protein
MSRPTLRFLAPAHHKTAPELSFRVLSSQSLRPSAAARTAQAPSARVSTSRRAPRL